MISFDDLSRMAYFIEPLPQNAHVIELHTYYQLRDIYGKYSTGALAKEDAESQKTWLQRAYDLDAVMYKMYQAGADREKAIRNIVSDMEKNGSERERLILRIMDGREFV